MTHDFPTIEEVVAMHVVLIDEFGGSAGIRDEGALAAAVMRPQLGYYGSLTEEATALMESLAVNHPSWTGTSGRPSSSRMSSCAGMVTSSTATTVQPTSS